MEKVINLLYVLTGMSGLIMAMNENANHINMIGVSLMALAVYFGKKRID